MEGILKDFKNLERVLKDRVHKKPFYYVPNPGNWGDALIRKGTLKFFRNIGLEYREIRPSRNNWSSWILPFVKGGTVIYGGGGGWCDLWAIGPKYVKYLHKRFNVIVLPSTYQHTYSYSDTTFFCRDKFQSQENIPESIFCHDMALYLDKIETKKGNETGYFFRRDKESSGKISIPKENDDLSMKGDYLTKVNPFIEKLSEYLVIHTDRLHVAIAGCLLGQEIHFYPGAYFKNYAIYKSSLKDNFENITFHKEYLDADNIEEEELIFE